jgi:hypothetical protein
MTRRVNTGKNWAKPLITFVGKFLAPLTPALSLALATPWNRAQVFASFVTSSCRRVMRTDRPKKM